MFTVDPIHYHQFAWSWPGRTKPGKNLGSREAHL
ncbi:hypothetical protein FHT76_006571 [Rhizobium sp. BK176]|nr:hypothetical protein [Rhizobium sp. BK181]MBB3543095.1 hypothetical protein [Rhizobium sp. BK399]MCS3742310.1 hypothetical protein [Rhizobium sp. BK661]MCS4094862.1 hypothetical protein [Rhizobium sp. BK176]